MQSSTFFHSQVTVYDPGFGFSVKIWFRNRFSYAILTSSADESDKVIWCRRCHLKKCQSYITFLSQVIFFVTFWQKKLNSIILLPKIQILTCSTLYLFILSNFRLKGTPVPWIRSPRLKNGMWIPVISSFSGFRPCFQPYYGSKGCV